MTNDCLRFHPTVATLCYGMNDHGYGPYNEKMATGIAAITPRSLSLKVRRARGPWFGRLRRQAAAVGASQEYRSRLEPKSLPVAQPRHRHAAKDKDVFADVFWPMLTAGFAAREKFGADYAVSGRTACIPIGPAM